MFSTVPEILSLSSVLVERQWGFRETQEGIRSNKLAGFALGFFDRKDFEEFGGEGREAIDQLPTFISLRRILKGNDPTRPSVHYTGQAFKQFKENFRIFLFFYFLFKSQGFCYGFKVTQRELLAWSSACQLLGYINWLVSFCIRVNFHISEPSRRKSDV